MEGRLRAGGQFDPLRFMQACMLVAVYSSICLSLYMCICTYIHTKGLHAFLCPSIIPSCDSCTLGDPYQEV